MLRWTGTNTGLWLLNAEQHCKTKACDVDSIREPHETPTVLQAAPRLGKDRGSNLFLSVQNARFGLGHIFNFITTSLNL